MNRYHDAMEHCGPPPELEERLRKNVLSAEPEPQARPAVYRPRGFFRKALLAAVLIVALTVSAGAAVLVHWDDIFADRFGPDAATTPMAEQAFQEVHVTSVCDDVTVTIREALVDGKSIYLILDYQLPDTVDPETVEMAYNSNDWEVHTVGLPDIFPYLTGDVSWEDFKAADQNRWATLDWTGSLSDNEIVSESTLADTKLRAGTFAQTESQGYDPDTNTLTYLYSITMHATDRDFTTQPLTLVVTPPVLWTDGAPQAVTDHPALVTFLPNAVSQTLHGSFQQDDLYAQVTLSPFAISVKVGTLSDPLPYQSSGDLMRSTSLVLVDSSILPVMEWSTGPGGGTSSSSTSGHGSVSFTTQFQDLLDVSQVVAVRVGDVEIPLD